MDEIKKIAEQIESESIILSLTLEEAMRLKSVLNSQMIKRGVPTDSGNSCPTCGHPLVRGNYYCGNCGQRVLWTDSDTIPL